MDRRVTAMRSAEVTGMPPGVVAAATPGAADVAARLPAAQAVTSASVEGAVSWRQDWRRWLHLGSQGGWAIADQALFAGSNLAVNVLLARWLPGAEYGAFVTAYTVLLLVQIAHAALLIEPLLIFGADRHRTAFSHYYEVLCAYHWKVMVVASGCLALVAAAVALWVDLLVGEAIAGLAVTAPFILLSWLARRGCLGASKPHLAAFGGAINFAAVLAGLWLLTRLDWLNVFSAQLLIGAAAVVTTLCMQPALRRLTRQPLSDTARARVWADHWAYARWSGATGALTWFYSFVYYLVLPRWYGLAASGVLKALLNLITPITHSDGALVTLLLPQFVRSRRVPGRFRRIVTVTTCGFMLESACYWLMLVLFGERLSAMLYGNTFHFDHVSMLLVGVIPPLGSLANILGNALRAREEPDGVFWATIAAVAVASTLGVSAVYVAGVAGAIVGMAASGVVQVGVMSWLLLRHRETARVNARTADVVHA